MPRLSKRRTRRTPRWNDDHLILLALGHDFFCAWGQSGERGRLGALPEEQITETIAEMQACYDANYDRLLVMMEENRWESPPWFEQYSGEAGNKALFELALADPCRIYLLKLPPQPVARPAAEST
jgi:hypothetical protein